MDEIKDIPMNENNLGIESIKTKSVDYREILGDSRAIFLSDDHTSVSVKDEILRSLAELSELGITDLALEMFPIGFDLSNDKLNLDYLETNWGDKGEGIAQKYNQIIKQAHDLGISVWGLDIPDDQYKSQSQSETFSARNQQWANLIKNRLDSDKNSKVAVFCGSGHSGYYFYSDRANNFLQRMGHDSVVVNFIGGDKPVDGISSPEEKKVQQYATDNQSERFMFKDNEKSRSSDYIVFTEPLDNI